MDFADTQNVDFSNLTKDDDSCATSKADLQHSATHTEEKKKDSFSLQFVNQEDLRNKCHDGASFCELRQRNSIKFFASYIDTSIFYRYI